MLSCRIDVDHIHLYYTSCFCRRWALRNVWNATWTTSSAIQASLLLCSKNVYGSWSFMFLNFVMTRTRTIFPVLCLSCFNAGVINKTNGALSDWIRCKGIADKTIHACFKFRGRNSPTTFMPCNLLILQGDTSHVLSLVENGVVRLYG